MLPIAVIDIGTNSIRLAVARPESEHHYNTVTMLKEVVRLGEGEFTHHRITSSAMERGLLVLKKFAGTARSHGAVEIIAIATAALREAQNRAEFVERAESECGVDVRVVSGVEEARLIYLGVASGADLGTNKGLFIDIGGGTTEISVGDSREYFMLESLKLGAIRVAEMFPAGESGKVSKKRFSAMLDHVRGAANHAVRRVAEHGFDQAYGSSGTIINLAEITARRLNENVTTIRNYPLRYTDLVETTAMLCGLTLEQRRNAPGINPERADIIISGGAVIQGIMEKTGAESIRVSDRGLRDGALIDHMLAEDEAKETYHTTSPRLRSILGMCRAAPPFRRRLRAQRTDCFRCIVRRNPE